uniref:Uncharacterized protein n=1 Tax=Kalanchoe fedtschenkoi TaxID=63787 RepID=A0A7N1A219_KALFE
MFRHLGIHIRVYHQLIDSVQIKTKAQICKLLWIIILSHSIIIFPLFVLYRVCTCSCSVSGLTSDQ